MGSQPQNPEFRKILKTFHANVSTIYYERLNAHLINTEDYFGGL